MKVRSSTIISSTKKTKKRRLQEAPAAYRVDLALDAGINPRRNLKDEVDVGALTSFTVPLTSDEEEKRRNRLARFSGCAEDHGSPNKSEPKELSQGLSSLRTKNSDDNQQPKCYRPRDRSQDPKKLVGTCTDLEKPYLRLTTFPKRENVRPLPVLMKSLAHIKNRFIQTEDFEWANEQLKSVRQDVTVQRLRNKFVLSVYETHARILLEHGDLAEFHQCQTMIRNLTNGSYCHDDRADDDEVDEDKVKRRDRNRNEDAILEDEVEGAFTCLKQSEEAADEFLGYSVLYALVQNSNSELIRSLGYATNQIDLESPRVSSSPCSLASSLSSSSSASSSPTPSDRERPVFLRGCSYRHALGVVKAVIHNDYQSFFRLYDAAPHMSAYLMDFLVRRVRVSAFERIITAYRPTLSVEHFREALFFHDLDETRRFLKKNAAIFIKDQIGPPFWVDCKASALSLMKR